MKLSNIVLLAAVASAATLDRRSSACSNGIKACGGSASVACSGRCHACANGQCAWFNEPNDTSCNQNTPCADIAGGGNAGGNSGNSGNTGTSGTSGSSSGSGSGSNNQYKALLCRFFHYDC